MMQQTGPYGPRASLGLVLGALLAVAQALAEDPAAEPTRVRYELSVGTHTWPGLKDVRALSGATFEAAGFNLGGAVHWPIDHWAGGELLLGLDLAIHNNESNIRLFSENLSLRDLYIGPSVKWMRGDRHRYSVDLGLTYHEIDLAELAGSYPNFSEIVVWNDRGVGAYLGGSFDVNAGQPGRRHGLLLAFRVHFVRFDLVGEDPLLIARFGAAAQKISGPIYSLQLGYRWR